MKNDEYKPRLIDAKISEYLDAFGAVCVEGPKWCGKTWSCTNTANSVFEVADPSGGFQNRKLAQMDPTTILQGAIPRLIDEWQEVPAIWDAVRFAVDQDQRTGQLLLTGSSTPARKGIHHSGAGRIARIKMDTMSLYELGESDGTASLHEILDTPPKAQLTGEVSLQRLAQLIANGGWPSQLRLNKRQKARHFAKEYLEAIVTDDLNRLEDTQRDIAKMKQLLRSLARNESTTASINLLVKDMESADGTSLNSETVSDYLQALNRMFVIADQPPFSANVRSSVRIKQAAKRHLADPSLSCALLGLNADSLMGDLRTFGFLFEALCEHDLRIYAQTIDAKLYHYQDYKNHEIDAVVEYPDGRWGAFEIKLGAHQIDDAANALLKLRDEFIADKGSRPPSFLCVICGLSNAVYTRPDGVIVVPITSLRN